MPAYETFLSLMRMLMKMMVVMVIIVMVHGLQPCKFSCSVSFRIKRDPIKEMRKP